MAVFVSRKSLESLDKMHEKSTDPPLTMGRFLAGPDAHKALLDNAIQAAQANANGSQPPPIRNHMRAGGDDSFVQPLLEK